jgi:hypothetical protein
MANLIRTLALGLFVAGFSFIGIAEDAAKPDATVQAEPLTAEEQAFATLLTGADLVGSFTVDGQDGAPKQDRYSITKAMKLKGNQWAIYARIRYGENDVTVPVGVNVDWAGKTPVLSVTDLKIPGLGSDFGTALLFQGDRYAGTWQHGKVGGHMWGRIERTPEAKPPVLKPVK